MKNLKTLLLAIAATTALPLSAAQYVFVPGNTSVETKICIAAAEDNLSKYKSMHRLLSSKRSVYSIVANQLKCNDENVASFAKHYDANRTANFINRFTDPSVIIRREISDVGRQSIVPNMGDDEIVYVTVN